MFDDMSFMQSVLVTIGIASHFCGCFLMWAFLERCDKSKNSNEGINSLPGAVVFIVLQLWVVMFIWWVIAACADEDQVNSKSKR